MATVKNRSTLGVRYMDASTQKEKTFNIGYVNPDNSEAINKIFAEKVMDLSNIGSSGITQIYTTDIVNITDASTDTTYTGIPIIDSSDFFSDDPAVFKAVIDSFDIDSSDSSVISFSMKTSMTAGGVTSKWAELHMFDIKNAASFGDVLAIINSKMIENGTRYARAVLTSNGFVVEDGNVDGHLIEVEIRGSLPGGSGDGYQKIMSSIIAGFKTPPAPFNGETGENYIKVTK